MAPLLVLNRPEQPSTGAFFSSYHRWLLVINNTNSQQPLYSLKDPETNQEIQLPKLQPNTLLSMAALSSPPPDSSCTVLFIISDSNSKDRNLVFCNPGDVDWIKPLVEQDQCACSPHPDNPQFLKKFASIASLDDGEIYLLSYCCRSLFGVRFNHDGSSFSVRLVKLEIARLEPDCLGYNVTSLSYMVRYSPTELLVVAVRFNNGYKVSYVDNGYRGVELYRVDLENRVCEKIESLGRDSEKIEIYIGCRPDNVILETKGCSNGNWIYMTHPKDRFIYAYDVAERSMTTLLLPNVEDYDSPEAIWIPESLSPDSAVVNVPAMKKKKKELMMILDCNVVELDDDQMWCKMPIHLLSYIQSRLFGADRCFFRLACKTWQSAFTACSYDDRLATLRMYRLPVLIHIGRNDSGNRVMILFNPVTNSTTEFPCSAGNGSTTIRCSKHGWLIMTEGANKSIFFHNPFTGERIDLPKPEPISTWKHTFQGITFSSPPTSPDCTVFGYLVSKQHIYSFHIRRGEPNWSLDTSIRDSTCFYPTFTNPVYHGSRFHFIGKNGNLCSVDTTNRTILLTNRPMEPCNWGTRGHLLELDGKLMSVFTGHVGSSVRVYQRVDQSWEGVESLGEERMLFLSGGSTVSANCEGLGVSGLGNKVFMDRFDGKDGVFYSLATGKFHTLWSGYESDDWCETKEYMNSAWIEPHFEKHTKEELRWC